MVHDVDALASGGPSHFAIARERWKRLIANQPKRNRRILELRIAGETYASIATQLEIHERTARRVVQKAIEMSAHPGPPVTKDLS